MPRVHFEYVGNKIASVNAPEDQRVKLLRGSDDTISELDKANLPPSLVLYAVASYAVNEDAGLIPRDSETVKKYAEQFAKYGGKASFASPSQLFALRQFLKSESEDRLMKHQRDREWVDMSEKEDRLRGYKNDRELIDDDSMERTLPKVRAMSFLHKIPEFRQCGLSKQTCSKWRQEKNKKRLEHAQALVKSLFRNHQVYREKDSPLFYC